MITLPKDAEAQLEANRAHSIPSSSSPSSSRTPFRDDPTETDALLDGSPSGDPHSAWLSGSAGPSGALAPSHHTGEHFYDRVAPLEPPPTFAPYQAEFFEVGNEEICSHDPHLNSDGEALYRFILARAQRPPFTRIHIKGTHTETKTRWVMRPGNDGRSRQHMETYTETVTDFSFCVDITPVEGYGVEPVHWSVADSVPAYRGKMVRELEEVNIPGLGSVRREKRKAKRKEVKRYDKWVEERKGRGLPPWCLEEDVEEAILRTGGTGSSSIGSFSGGSDISRDSRWVESLADVEASPLRSSKTLRQWADEYCASPKRLKEFVYEQELYGWNMQQIESAMRSTIIATPYNGTLEISFTKHRSRIYIRPDNRLSRMLSNSWLKFLSIILLIFPFIWLFKRFHSRGGGKWNVCGAAYPMKKWVPINDQDAGDVNREAALPPYVPVEDPYASPWQSPTPFSPLSMTGGADQMARTRSSSSRMMQTSSGPKKLLGLREGEWFRRWEGAITRAVMARYQASTPLQDPGSAPGNVVLLDGYLG